MPAMVAFLCVDGQFGFFQSKSFHEKLGFFNQKSLSAKAFFSTDNPG